MAFKAKYRGDCILCDEPVIPGQLVEFNWDRELQHVTCPENRHTEPRPICNSCHMEQVPDGTTVGFWCPDCDEDG